MEINVTFRHMEQSDSIKKYAEEKVSKINKYIDFPIDAHIVLAVEKFRQLADVTLNANGTTIKAVEETEDMYSSIDQVMDKIEKQIKKYMSKGRSRRADVDKTGGQDDSFDMSMDDPTIEVEKMEAKPMDAEEAAMQFSMSNQEFMVFRNPRSNDINVIYRRKDGNLGLIEPAS